MGSSSSKIASYEELQSHLTITSYGWSRASLLFLPLALAVTVHCHTSAVNHVPHACAVCLIGTPSKAFVVPLAVLPFYYEARAICVGSMSNRLSFLLWHNTSNRSPPLLA